MLLGVEVLDKVRVAEIQNDGVEGVREDDIILSIDSLADLEGIALF